MTATEHYKSMMSESQVETRGCESSYKDDLATSDSVEGVA